MGWDLDWHCCVWMWWRVSALAEEIVKILARRRTENEGVVQADPVPPDIADTAGR